MRYLIAAASLLACATPAMAATVTVTTDPNAPESNFQAPTSTAKAGYTLSLSDNGSSVLGTIVQTGGTAVGAFANLYFDLNPTVMDGSDLGFELGANGATAFIPGKNGQPGFNTVLDPSTYTFSSSTSGGNITVNFSLSNTLFTGPIAGLAYYNGQTFEQNVTLRLSQSLSYSVAGGASYGADRLGTVSVGVAAVPEPATWAMMLVGFGMVAGAARYRRRSPKVSLA